VDLVIGGKLIVSLPQGDVKIHLDYSNSNISGGEDIKLLVYDEYLNCALVQLPRS
jgi:hypothetical protein